MGDLEEVRDPLTLFPSELSGPGEVALQPAAPVAADPAPAFPETGVVRPAFVLTGIETQRLLVRRRFSRYVRRPLRHAARALRKQVVLARATIGVQADALHRRAMSMRPALRWPRVTVVVRVPAASRVIRVPALISATSTVALIAMISPLLVAIGPSMPSPVLPAVTPPTLATIGPPPVLLEEIMSFAAPAAASLPAATRVATRLPAALRSATTTPGATASAGRSPRFVGTLIVESEPAGATVFINQERVGQTPLTLPDLRAGSRAVWVESEGYQRWTAGVLVPADKLTRINVKLQREPPR